MPITFFSDPHLGVRRLSHTTPESRQALQREVYLRALGGSVRQFGNNPTYCLGDLFDTDTNDEATIAQGLQIAGNCGAVLAGNHDMTNRASKLSSLRLIQQIYPDKVIAGETGEAGFDVRETDEGLLVFVPHMSSQELFEASLAEASCYADEHRGAVALCLHANYESPFVTTDSTLNLTRERAEWLLHSFKYVLLGHEHIARSDFGGRLQVLGNTFPTSFSDISDKFVWHLENGQLRSECVWREEEHHYRVAVEEVLAGQAYFKSAQVIDVVGEVDAKDLPAAVKTIHDLWGKCPDALMIRNSVTVKESFSADEARETARLSDAPSRVRAELAGTPLLGLFNKYLGRL